MLNIESVLSGLMGDTMAQLGTVVAAAIKADTSVEFTRLSLGSTGHEEPMYDGEFVNMFITPVFTDNKLTAYDIKCDVVESLPPNYTLDVVDGGEIYLAFEQFLVSKAAYNIYHEDFNMEDVYND